MPKAQGNGRKVQFHTYKQQSEEKIRHGRMRSTMEPPDHDWPEFLDKGDPDKVWEPVIVL